ncbi:MAG: amidohydrolase family protein [Acidobacteria bacterium]|nr:amidohydrolase family protein [Acidobacteriota bacterium]
MRHARRSLVVTLLTLLASPAATAQKKGLSLEATRTIAFTTSEGTYMNVDVSPDGSTLVFDLLGDLYTLPAAGGQAVRLTSGLAHDTQPTFSPDGTRVAFISDRSGSDNLWVLDLTDEAAKPEAISTERAKVVSTPEWDPDGEYLLARRSGDLWLYHVDGGSGLQLSDSDRVRGITGPTFGPEGRYIYFAASGGGFPSGLARVNGWQARRLDRVTGDVVSITASPNGAYRPRVSPDGHWMVYGARVDAQTGLRIRDLRSSRERWLAFPIDRDNAERPGVLDLMPRWDFTPDSAAVVLATGGTFHRIALEDGADTTIAFSADVEIDLGPFVFFESPHDDGPVHVRNVRYAGANADSDRIVFSALSKLWTMALPDGTPAELVHQPFGQFQPVFSNDGAWIAYVTWDDVDGGHLWKVPSSGGNPVRLTEHAGFYLHPAWSPDDSKLALVREDAAVFRNIWSRNTGEIVWLPATGDGLSIVGSAPSDNRLTFSAEGDRIRFVASVASGAFDGSRPARSELVSVRLDGTDRRVVANINAETWEAVPSPDGQWLAWTTREDVYVAALPFSPEPPSIGESSGPGPVKRVTREGGLDIHWEDGSDTLAWVFGDTYYRFGLEDALWEAEPEEDDADDGAPDGDASDDGATTDATVGDDADSTGTDADIDAVDEEPEGPQPTEFVVNLDVDRRIPRGAKAIVGATVVPMTGAEATIPDGVVLIEDNRITAVGSRDEVTIPDGTEIFDASGKFVIPGLIDLHAHLRQPREVFVQTNWSYLANLAYGVTSARDVSTSSDSFAYAELVETGAVWGPRIYSTGRAMTSGNAKIDSLEDARAMLRHYKKLGTDVVKQYMQPHRRQRQWVIQAAMEEEMNVTNEGGGDLRLNITQILDGYTGLEHSLPIADVYDDVVQLIAQSQTWYTPTLVVSYGGPTAEWYFYQTTEVHDDPKLSRFTPHDDLDRRTRRGQMNALDEYHFIAVAEGAARVLQAGGNVGMGAHGEQQGICAHWEIWALQMGGLTNYDALRTATSIAADGLGRAADLGTIEVGKLADLVVLDANPLADIRNTNTVRLVIKNGDVHDGDTLARLGNDAAERPSIGYRATGAPPETDRR